MQTLSMLVGAVLGAVWSLRHSAAAPEVLVSAFLTAWLAIGIHGLVRGKVTIAGRRGRTPKVYAGVQGRLAGLVLIAFYVAFAAIVHAGPV